MIITTAHEGPLFFLKPCGCEHVSVQGQPRLHTHRRAHTQVGSGGRTAHTDLILSDKTLWGVQRERGRWRAREKERDRHGKKGVRETLQGPLLPTMAIK